MNLADTVSRAAEARPDHPAILFEGHTLTYGALLSLARQAAGALAAAGVVAGDRVGLLIPNVPAFPVAFLGALRLGAIAVPINASLTTEELDYMLGDAGIKVLATLAGIHETLSEGTLSALDAVVLVEELGHIEGPGHSRTAAAQVSPETPAMLIYSSGTTGVPKGVTLSHGNVLSNIRVNAREIGVGPEDRLGLFMPLFHCYGLNVIMNSAFVVGATVVMERHFDPAATPQTIARAKVTMFFGVPTTFIVLLQKANLDGLRSLRYCYCAAAPLPPEIEDAWLSRVGVIVNQAYGLTEASPCVMYNHVTDYRRGSIGVPSEGVEVKVMDPETLEAVPPGTVGELWVSSPGVMLGYWGRPEASAKVLRDGWLRTGDLVRVDEDGYFYITDRMGDRINCGGMKVYPTEVENALYRHPSVGEAAVVGAPDDTMGEVVWAYVSPKAGHAIDVSELRRSLHRHLADYKLPTTLRVEKALPKGRTGKILRRALRERAREEVAHPGLAPPWAWTSDELRTWIVDWLRQELAIDGDHSLSPRATFADIGVDSLMAVRKAEALSELLGRHVPATVTWLYGTPEQLAAYLTGSEDTAVEGHRDPVQVSNLTDEEAAAQLEAELRALRI